MNELGKNIRLLRRKQGWSQEDIALKLDISIPAFSKIETGVTDINLSRLEQIAAVFDMSVISLVAFNHNQDDTRAEMLDVVRRKLMDREMELIDLQKKVIELYEEIKNTGTSTRQV